MLRLTMAKKEKNGNNEQRDGIVELDKVGFENELDSIAW